MTTDEHKRSDQFLENQKIRTAWDGEQEQRFFSVADAAGMLTDTPDYNTGKTY